MYFQQQANYIIKTVKEKFMRRPWIDFREAFTKSRECDILKKMP